MSNFAVSRPFIAGVAGSSGGFTAGAGTALSVGTANQILGGTGGGGIAAGAVGQGFPGGSYNAVANTPFVVIGGGRSGGTQSGSHPGGPGPGGFRFGKFPLFYGGTGGGSADDFAGGNGGNAQVPGAGGGGGGAGAGTGGNGGAGGPGQVIMIAF